MSDRQYPVIVNDTREHVIWIEADSPEDAVTRAARDTYYRIDDEQTLASRVVQVTAPAKFDWPLVTDDSYMGYEGTRYDEHVQIHEHLLWKQERAALQAVCSAEGHANNRHRWANGRIECRLCLIDLASEPAAATATVTE